MQKSYHTTKKDAVRNQVLLDATDKVLGRLSTQIVSLLQGKHKAIYAHHADCGDTVTVINAAKVKITGKKAFTKTYFSHSNYPGGDKLVSYEKMMKEHPERIIFHAVSGMLPKNKLRAKMLKRLRLYPGAKDAAV
jgi:large subunit ribosomal protein L13